MPRPKSIPIALDEIRRTAEGLLEEDPDPIVRLLLLSKAIELPDGHSEVTKARKGLSTSRWVQLLKAEQKGDGGWGGFHTKDYRLRQRTHTTEAAVERSRTIGLRPTDPPLRRTVSYLASIVSRRMRFPDAGARHPAAEPYYDLIAASTLATASPHHSALTDTVGNWCEIAGSAFRGRELNHAKAAHACADLLALPQPVAEELVTFGFNCKYLPSVLAAAESELTSAIRTRYLKYLLTLERGIGYISANLAGFPVGRQPRDVNAWFVSWELLSRFSGWRAIGWEAMDWLCAQRNDDGYWDFGKRYGWNVSGGNYMPLSENWRKPIARRHDWTTRTLLLLKAYHG